MVGAVSKVRDSLNSTNTVYKVTIYWGPNVLVPSSCQIKVFVGVNEYQAVHLR